MQNWENFGISILYICKNFLKGSKWYVFAKESNRTICMSEIEKCHSCHLHTKSLMPLSNFFYALCREKLFFADWKCAYLTEDGRSMSLFSLLILAAQSGSNGQLSCLHSFIPQIKWHNLQDILMYQKILIHQKVLIH